MFYCSCKDSPAFWVYQGVGEVLCIVFSHFFGRGPIHLQGEILLVGELYQWSCCEGSPIASWHQQAGVLQKVCLCLESGVDKQGICPVNIRRYFHISRVGAFGIGIKGNTLQEEILQILHHETIFCCTKFYACNSVVYAQGIYVVLIFQRVHQIKAQVVNYCKFSR